MMYIHYRITDGEIIEMGNGDPPPLAVGLARVFSGDSVDPSTKKVDVAEGRIVSKTVAEIDAFNAPTEIQVRQAILGELVRTDSYMLPDRDDVAPNKIVQWTAYRKALRDLSKGDPRPTAAQMMVAWPLDPDGNDRISYLRDQINPLAKRGL